MERIIKKTDKRGENDKKRKKKQIKEERIKMKKENR